VLSDLKEGKSTLPLIYAMENGHRDAREWSRACWKKKNFIPFARKHSCTRTRNPVRSTPRALAQDYAQRAKAASTAAPIAEFGRALATLPDFILEREN